MLFFVVILILKGLHKDFARPVSCFSCCVSKQFWPEPDRRSSLFRQPNTGNKDRASRAWRIDERSKLNCHIRPVWKPIQPLLNFPLGFGDSLLPPSSCFPTGKDEARTGCLFHSAAGPAFEQLILQSKELNTGNLSKATPQWY